MNNSNYFFCYNRYLSDFLVNKGLKFVTVARDLKTQKIFSLFEINDELQEALEQYKSIKK